MELYEATFEPRWLAEASGLMQAAIEHFWDADGGAFFLSPDDGEPLPVRAKEGYDGATPSGNSVAALVLLRLARIVGDAALEEKAARIFTAFASEAAARPSSYTFLMMALDFAVGPSAEVVIAGERDQQETQRMLQLARKAFLPNAVLLLRDSCSQTELAALAPAIEAQVSEDGAATAYVCRQYACEQPLTDVEALAARLKEI